MYLAQASMITTHSSRIKSVRSFTRLDQWINDPKVSIHVIGDHLRVRRISQLLGFIIHLSHSQLRCSSFHLISQSLYSIHLRILFLGQVLMSLRQQDPLATSTFQSTERLETWPNLSRCVQVQPTTTALIHLRSLAHAQHWPNRVNGIVPTQHHSKLSKGQHHIMELSTNQRSR